VRRRDGEVDRDDGRIDCSTTFAAASGANREGE
jgi:hypothetical protein